MAVTRKYRLNLKNYGAPPSIQISQYDEGYALVFDVFDGSLPAAALNAYTVKLTGIRADRLSFEFTGTVSGTLNNVLSFTIDTTMSGCAGKGVAEIQIIDSTNDVMFASFNIPVFVERAAVPDGSIDADEQALRDLAEQVQDIVDTAAATVEGEAEKWAVGTIDGDPVPDTDPAYNNYAKYYSEAAAASAASIVFISFSLDVDDSGNVILVRDDLVDVSEVSY